MPLLNRLRMTLASVAAAILASGAAADAANDLVADDLPVTFSGSYLAGRSADIAKDIHAAVKFYGNALDADPDNPGLTERLLLLGLANRDFDRAFPLAEGLTSIDRGNPIAQLALAVRSIKSARYDEAQTGLSRVAPAPLATLTAGLMTAWAQFGQGEVEAALDTIDALAGPSWYAIFKDYHTAVILDAAGRLPDAVTAIDRAYDSDAMALRIVDAYARIHARAGDKDKAIAALVEFGGEAPLHPLVRELLMAIRSGEDLPPIAGTAQLGGAETLYGLGSAIGPEEGPELPAAYLRLATYLNPSAYLATMAIGDVFQGAGRCEDAIAIYETVPRAASLRRNADIQMGNCLEALDQTDKAVAIVKRVVDANPNDFEAAVELGNLYRSDNRFAEAAEAYGRGIAAIADPSQADWRMYYFRGVSYERSKRWAEAEADFKRALAINPEQPQVLNYLGYSWVDMGVQLNEALEMIKTAVGLRPNDGYIVDSLGWAYYRLNRFEEAVRELERAVELRPEDPIINDHLGDAYWKAGRKREALFQWAHARDLEPEADQLPIILAKLENGLTERPVAGATDETARSTAATDAGGEASTSIMVEDGDSLWAIADRVYGDARLYLRIYEANRDQISVPDVIFPGTRLKIPAAETN